MTLGTRGITVGTTQEVVILHSNRVYALIDIWLSSRVLCLLHNAVPSATVAHTRNIFSCTVRCSIGHIDDLVEPCSRVDALLISDVADHSGKSTDVALALHLAGGTTLRKLPKGVW